MKRKAIGTLAAVAMLASCATNPAAKDNVATIHENYIDTIGEATAGFSVDIEFPKGDSQADREMREFLLSAIRQDIFWQINTNPSGVVEAKSNTPSNIAATLERYNALWKEGFTHDFPEHDTLALRLTSEIKTEKTAETDEYLTYYYQDYQDYGGAHGMPFSFYITYDKQRNDFVGPDNAFKQDKWDTYRQLLLETLNKMKEERGWEADLTKESLINSTENMFYPCDKLVCPPHLAILPEGVVVTFHPYQIGSFAEGEYHALLPKDKISDCLNEDYW